MENSASGEKQDTLSLTGQRWIFREASERAALTLKQRLGISDEIARILAAREISVEDAAFFLEPKLRDSLPDPARFRDMSKAAELVHAALEAGLNIAIFGDYDVDGATSSALLLRFFRQLGKTPRLYIPDRETEGYGPNPAAMDSLADEETGLVITVDCGITAEDSISRAKDRGMQVIVIDHHQAEPKLPPADAIINPNRLDEAAEVTHDYGHLAAVGVTFLFLVALNRHLRDNGYYEKNGLNAPDLTGLLDLVALGTVCDVVPLTGLNRAYVAQGLKVMGQGRNMGLSALAETGRMEGPPEAWHAGFVLGPRINAGGRMGCSDYGAKLLATSDPGEAGQIARHLDGLNSERKDIEQAMLDAAFSDIEARGLDDKSAAPFIMTMGEGWHPGVIGIVASRIKDRYHKPCFVAAINAETGEVTASGRSIGGVNLGAAVIAARQAGLLQKGGGHAMAAGFTAHRDSLDDLSAFFAERFGAMITADMLVPELHLDLSLAPRAASVELVAALEKLGPFGVGNAEPRVMLRGAVLHDARTVGGDQSHVSCWLGDPAGGKRVKAIAFRAMESDLGPALVNNNGRPMDLAGTLRIDSWQGTHRPQLQIKDARWSQLQ